MSFVLVLVFVVLMVLAIPVGHALIIAGAAAVLWGGDVPLLAVVQQMFDQTQSFPMLALPFFMLAGALMMGGKFSILDYMIWNEIPTILGNIVGGLAFTGLMLYSTHARTGEKRGFAGAPVAAE